MRLLLRASRNPIIRWWWSLDRLTVFIILSLLAVGLVFVTTASSGVAETYEVDAYYFARRQLVFMLGALPAMFFISGLSIKGLKRFGLIMFIVALLGLFATLFLGTEVKGARRWIDLGIISIQPTEFLKPAFVVMMAYLLGGHGGRHGEQYVRGFFISIAILITIAIGLFMQPDFGSFIVFCAVWGTMLFVAGFPYRILAVLAGLGLGGAGLGYMLLPHVRSRLHRFLDPASGDTYQVDRAHEAFLSGGLFGRGPGEGVVKHVLPDAHTDFIFAVIGEEFGVLMCSLLLIAYGFIIIRSFNRLLDRHERFVVLMGSGLLMLLSLQVLVNTGVALNVLPTKGMTLPLISYGGSSTLSVCILLGMILALTKKREDRGVINRKYQ